MRVVTLRAVGVVLLLGGGVLGCAPRPGVALSPEAAVRACEAPAAVALRSRDSGFRAVTLHPAAASRVERRAFRVGSQEVGTLVAGHGSARGSGAASGEFRYLCLIGPDGQALFVDVETADGAAALAECDAPARASSPRLACARDLLREAELALAVAEARAIAAAREGRPRDALAEVEQPVVASIGAWRVYRDAECARRRDVGWLPTELHEACRVSLTRQRVAELGR
jgi:uncharacterized protein YecT (DUF1311 family)